MSLPERIIILKGDSVKSLEPLVLIKVPPDVEKLSDMRSMLARFKYMSSTDSFVDPSGYPIHKEDEKGIPTTEALGDPSDRVESTIDEADLGSSGKSSEGRGSKAKVTTRYQSLSVLSKSLDKRTWNPKPIDYPHKDRINGDKPKGDDLPKSQIDLSKTIDLENAAASKDKALNAKTLNKEQVDDVFEINNVFGGISFIGPMGACSQIFEPPNELSSLIWVHDDSSLDIQEFKSSTMNSMFKQGAWGISGKLGYKALSLGGGFDREYSYEEKTDSGYKVATGVYRYSRAVIRLPLASMKPTAKFQNELAAAFADASDEMKKARLSDLFNQYGQAFAFEIQLGGHLYTTETVEQEDTEKKQSAKTKIQASFALDFGLGNTLGLSGNYERESGSGEATHFKHSGLVVEAVGGDTLLSSNLKLWPSSVMPHTNWRITRRSDIRALIDIPSLFSKERKDEVVHLFGPFDKELPLKPGDIPVKPKDPKEPEDPTKPKDPTTAKPAGEQPVVSTPGEDKDKTEDPAAAK